MTSIVSTGLRVQLQVDLFNRMRGRPNYFQDDFARVFAKHEGTAVEVQRAFYGNSGAVASYNVVLDGKLYHCPARYVTETSNQEFDGRGPLTIAATAISFTEAGDAFCLNSDDPQCCVNDLFDALKAIHEKAKRELQRGGYFKTEVDLNLVGRTCDSGWRKFRLDIDATDSRSNTLRGYFEHLAEFPTKNREKYEHLIQIEQLKGLEEDCKIATRILAGLED